MTYYEMSDMLQRLEHLDTALLASDMNTERELLQPLYKRLALHYATDKDIKKDCETILDKYSAVVKAHDKDYQIRL